VPDSQRFSVVARPPGTIAETLPKVPLVLELRPLTAPDLALVETWLTTPHVAEWYLKGSSLEAELDEIRAGLTGDDPTIMLLVLDDSWPIGWCQWYRCDDNPDHAKGVGAEPGDIGIDYAIGEPASVGRGTGTRLIAALVEHVRAANPGAGIITDPEAANIPSRRVLEKNGFELLGVRPVESESTAEPMAIYRLGGATPAREAAS
jgi:RimJ/RimL family protein N-acetyltransferase